MCCVGGGNVTHVGHRASQVCGLNAPKHLVHREIVEGIGQGRQRKQSERPRRGRVHTRHSRGKRTSNEPVMKSSSAWAIRRMVVSGECGKCCEECMGRSGVRRNRLPTSRCGTTVPSCVLARQETGPCMFSKPSFCSLKGARQGEGARRGDSSYGP